MFYKFLNTEHIANVLQDGIIVLSSLKYFRNLEDKQKPWIGDRLEGATELTTPSQLTLTENSPELDMVNQANIGLGAFQKFAHVSNGGRIEMGGVKFVHTVPHMYVYSFSGGDLDELKKQMCVEAIEPYNACLKISDPIALLSTIMERGIDFETNVVVGTFFKQAGLGPVSYEKVVQDIRSGPVIPPDPFKKAPHFAGQSEHRLLFDPSVSLLPDRIFIKIPDTGKHFQVEFRDFKAHQTAMPTQD